MVVKVGFIVVFNLASGSVPDEMLLAEVVSVVAEVARP